MTETFDFKRQAGASGQITYRVRSVQFGDGYRQVAQDGINNKVQKWPLSFEGSLAEMQVIMDFFDRHYGAKSFLWTPPGYATPLLFTAKDASLISQGAGVFSISVEFEQVYTL